MIPYITAKKAPGIDDLISRLNPSIPEPQRQIQRFDSAYDRLFRKYEELLAFDRHTPLNPEIHDQVDALLDSINEVLGPSEINVLYQQLAQYEPRGRNHADGCGLFLGVLVQTSYNAGHNNFMLDCTDLKPVNWIGAWLSGSAQRPLVLTVEGDTGDGFCYDAEYVHAGVGYGLAFFTNKSRHCVFTVKEYPFLEDWSVHDNVYRTTDIQALTTFGKNVPTGKNNILIFIDPDGKEIVARNT